MPVTIKAFKEAKTKADLQKKMKEAIEKASGNVRYVAAKDYKIAGAPVQVFMVVDKITDFLVEIKKQPGIKFAEGEATVTKDTENKVNVKVTIARGGLGAYATSSLVKLAAGNDPDIVGSIPDSGPNPEHDGVVTNEKVAKIVQASHEQARKEGKIDYEIQFTNELVTNMAKASFESAEFGKFNQNFLAFLKKYDMEKLGSDAGKLPMKMWGKLIQGLVKSGYVKEIIPKAEDGTSFILATKGAEGKPIREKLLAQAMEGLEPFTSHAGQYLDQVISKAEKGATWAFWSGAGAEDAAKASPGVSLEGSIGSMFAAYYGEWINFPKLTGVADLALWAAMSELYAKRAAESLSKFKFIGFIGPGATREQSVFNQIEQPTFVEVAQAKAAVPPPPIDWFVVQRDWAADGNGRATYKGAQGNWIAPPVNKPHLPFSTRESALAKIVELYEM